MSKHRGIIAYDFERSFSPTNSPNRITSGNGEQRLGSDVWEAGAAAVEYLQNVIHITEKSLRPNLQELQEAMPQLAAQLESELENQWLPLLTLMIEAGAIIFKPKHLTQDKFIEIWNKKDFVERGHTVLQLHDSFRTASQEWQQDIEHSINTLAATCLLYRIDDAAIAIDLGDIEEVSTSSIEIADFLRVLNWSKNEGQSIEIAVKSAIRRRAQSGGHAKYKGQAEAKSFVQREWEAHKDAYGGNKSAFARDYVRRVHNELEVQVTEKTLREVWLNTPVTSKPAE